MKDNKNIDVQRIQDFLDAHSSLEKAKEKLDGATHSMELAQDEIEGCESSICSDENLAEMLKKTGIRTINDKLISIDEHGQVMLSSYTQIPATWDFKK